MASQPPTVSFASIPQGMEIRYEGIWYGAERIWVGDTVRLSPERPAFTESIRLGWESQLCPPSSPGADLRGVLMRIDRIFITLSEDGQKECNIAGPLYEVAPANYVGIESPLRKQEVPGTSQLVEEPMINPWDPPRAPKPEPITTSLPLDPPSPFPLPPAPPGYILRPLLPVGSELPIPVSFMAGRYYPDLFDWLPADIAPQIPPAYDNAFGLEALAFTPKAHLLSLCGLAPGRFNHAVGKDVQLANRTKMIHGAAMAARQALEKEFDDQQIDIV